MQILVHGRFPYVRGFGHEAFLRLVSGGNRKKIQLIYLPDIVGKCIMNK